MSASAFPPRSFADALPLERVSGLRPGAWICVGAGFSREEVKALVLGRGGSLAGPSITGLAELAQRIVEARRRLTALAESPAQSHAQRLASLGSLARQEALRLLLADPRILSRTPELKRLRRQSGFYRRLDSAIQGGRLAAASPDEEEVYLERLEQRLGINPVRREVRLLAGAYEAWLEAMNLWDPPRLLREATAILRDVSTEDFDELALDIGMPQEIHDLSGNTKESLEAMFWEALGARREVVRVMPKEASTGGEAGVSPDLCTESALPGPIPPSAQRADGRLPLRGYGAWGHERWHTLDDAAERLADELASLAEDDFARLAVLIPDQGAVRRTLKRALAAHGLPLEDTRDPQRLQWDETIKWAMLPLEVAGQGYERDTVVSWLRGYWYQPEYVEWTQEIASRGIREGLRAYAGGKLAGVHARLTELEAELGGRRTAAQLAEGHLALLRAAVGLEVDRAWVVEFFEGLWKEYAADLARLGLTERRAPLRFWLDRLESRVAESPAPVERLKAASGVRVYRLSQLPLVPAEKVYVLGLPPGWLGSDGASVGDYWLSERDRETLCGEFAVRSAIQVRRERLTALRHWLGGAEEAIFLDAEYDVDGRERESILPALREVAEALVPAEAVPGLLPLESVSHGSHPRWSASFGAWRPYPPQAVELPPPVLRMGERIPEMTATALDRYSRCGLQALAMQRWKLWDTREPDVELWPEVRGNILHAAVTELLRHRDAEGGFTLTPAEALERAWAAKPPKGLLRGPRIERWVRARLLTALETFCEDEREYQKRAGTRTLALDDELPLRLEFTDFAVVGMPDRVEEHPQGVFIMDFKTSSSLPSGTEMLDLGYRLQLPFYALAARRQLGREALGVQFVELTPRGGRSRGIFFADLNGKEPGKLTQTRSNSRSLVAGSREEAWARAEESLVAHARGWFSGRFEARPKKKEAECRGCAASDLCGLRRLGAEGEESGEAAE